MTDFQGHIFRLDSSAILMATKSMKTTKTDKGRIFKFGQVGGGRG